MRPTACALCLAVAACTGEIAAGPGAAEPDSPAGTSTVPGDPAAAPVAGGPAGAKPSPSCARGPFGRSPMRRLSRTEYVNTVRDLFRDPALPVAELAIDPLVLGFENNADASAVTATAADRYMNAAEAISVRVTNNLAALSPCLTGPASGEAACVQQLIRSFGERAYRRPIVDTEAAALTSLFAAARADGDSLSAALAVMLQGILESPSFLYRFELSPPAAGETAAKLSPWELATRLSYLLWSSMPDDQLFAAARAGRLGTKAEVAAQAQRMLADPRARAMTASFHRQWLALYMLGNIQKDPVAFKDFTPPVAQAMQQESEAFVDDLTWTRDGDVTTLFTAAYTFRNKTLADFYKVAGPTGSGLERIDLDGSRYSGLLTQGGMMAALAHENQTSPTLRGKFVRQQLLCAALPAPPPGLVVVVPPPNPAATTRETVTAQRGPGTNCWTCHQLMDGIGFGLEGFDAVGRPRTRENNKPIDTASELAASDVDGPFAGPPALGQKLAASAQVRGCMVTQWFRFTSGRAEEDADACTIEALAKGFASSGNKVRGLLTAITQSDAFFTRAVGATP